MIGFKTARFLSLSVILSIALAPISWGQSTGGFDVLSQTRNQLKVLLDGREIAVYHSGEALDKSYIHPLWTPDRHCVTYDAPADHLHHRALSVGWPDVSGTDFWAEINSLQGKRGRVLTTSLDTKSIAEGGVRVVENNKWIREDGSAIVRGKYLWTFWKPQGNLQAVDVVLELEALESEVIFGSDPEAPREYHGLTLRIGPFADIRYYNSEGTEGGQNCSGRPARWCAATGMQHGSPVTVALLNCPSNDRHPTRFYIQDQGMQFISSSPNFGKPKVLKKGETWRLKYSVIAAGKPDSEKGWDLENLWRQYVERSK